MGRLDFQIGLTFLGTGIGATFLGTVVVLPVLPVMGHAFF